MTNEERAALREFIEVCVDLAVTKAISGLDREALRGPPGKDGTDGLAGKDGCDGVDGKDGAPGDRGEKGDPGERGEKGMDGEAGPMGQQGERGPIGERGEKGLDGKDAKDGRDGRDGKDGVGTKDEIIAIAKDLVESLEPVLEERLKAFSTETISKLPVLRFMGIYKAGQTYTPGQTVQWAGDTWHANVETKEKPGGNDDWTLMVRKGRDFRPPDRKAG